MSMKISNIEYLGGAEFSEADLRKLDLNLLLAFSAVMRTGSVRAAAERLFLGPSGVSMALSRLRLHLGEELFVRGKAGLEPTPFAERLFELIAPALGGISAALGEVGSFDPSSAERTVRIAMSDDIETALAANLAQRVRREAPGITLILRTGDYRRAPSLLDGGEADLVLCAKPPALQARHRARALYREEFVLLADGPRLGLPERPSMETYLTLAHVLVSAEGMATGLTDEALAKLGRARRVALVAERFSTLPYLLKSADLVANVPRRAAESLAGAFGLSRHALPFESPAFEVSAIWPGRLERDPAHAWLRTVVAEEVGEPAASGSG
ncbi:transcriptional regulator MexT [Sphingomonas oleivorans]|uniref:Transcriptional regulator MexT n=1 Tax=Sphingomonas oleivorans TaxID=1735121 RepID=A0A2T5G2E9_9SPHN|nr:LysR family transcriptional regulator [Sphingomonas oleivorans]PTQ13314.1 transcriptional regulator MexT [Sphingomonas oleivorans]